jgi:mono/diheme cytochrome c family protein
VEGSRIRALGAAGADLVKLVLSGGSSMRKLLRVVAVVVMVLVVGVAGLLMWVRFGLPDVGPAPEISVDRSPERVARGAYLANHVMVCTACHAERDWSTFAAPPLPGTAGRGGEVHDQRLGFPGSYVSTNLTPFGLGDWSDGEVLRAVTSGVSKDGRALFPIMPHPAYGQLDREDVEAVIAYLRTLEPIEYTPPASSSDFPMNFIINLIPKPAAFRERPVESDRAAYGEYLVRAAVCEECHTEMDKGKAVGAPFAGGMVFPLADGSVVRSPNLTPHLTGLGSWTEEAFVARFRAAAGPPQPVSPGGFQTVMPWRAYAGMTDADLGAIYTYLRNLPPTERVVERFTPAAAR